MSRAIKRILAGAGGLLLGLSTPLLAVQSYAPALEPNQANAYSSQQLSEQQLLQLARAITVKVLSEQGWGSGILVEKQGASYKVLTNDHVLGRYRYRGWQIQTPDGKIHRGELIRTVRLNDYDLGLVSFRSSRVYSITDLANVDDLAIGDEVFAAGFPPELGYEIVYTSVTYGGMSGGPLLDLNGRVIAVHGQNEAEKIEKVPVPIGFSLAIPITTFLKLAPQSGIQGQINVESSPPNALSLREIGDELYKAFEVPNNNDTNPLNWLNQGNKMWRLVQLALAYAAYEKALQLDAQLYQAWYGKGLLLTYWKRHQEALAAYEQALKINPDSDTAKKLRDKLQESLGGGNTPSLTPSQPTTAPTVEPSPQPSNPRRLW